MNKTVWLIVAAILILIIIGMTSKKVSGIVKNFVQRGNEPTGSGKFGASRDGGKRKHQGIDIVVKKGEQIFAPFDMELLRITQPYKDDNFYKGAVYISDDLEIRIYYFTPFNKKSFKKGEIIGIAQDISEKYKGVMSTHIHVEIRKNGVLVNPELYV